MELKEATEKLKELIKHKNDYDEAYGTKIYRPYLMSKKDWECIEIVLEEIENYKNTIEVIEDLGRKKISEILEKAESRTMTNGDKIRQMNNEELAKLMNHECMCCMQGEYCETSCKEGIKAFLDEEAE